MGILVSDGAKDKLIQLRVTEKQKDIIQVQAKKNGYSSTTSYILRLIENDIYKELDEKSDQKYIELRGKLLEVLKSCD